MSTDMLKNRNQFLIFFIIAFLFNAAASFAHPVTPTLIVERNLDSSMFGVALAAMMTMYFLFSPLWGRLCSYMPVKRILLICCLGYAAGQIIFGLAQSEAAVIGGRMFAGIFTGGCFVGMANYVVNLCGSDLEQRGRNLVILTTLQNVGSAVGYFIGGTLGLISVETAFLSQVAVLSLSGILWYFLCRDDTAYKIIPDEPLRMKDINPFSAIMAAKSFMTPMLAMVFMITAISAVGQNSYEQCFNYFIKDQYGMSSAYNGMFKAGIAILTLVLNMTVSLYLSKRTDIHKTFLYILAACTALISLVLFHPSQILFISVYIVYSSVMVLRLPLLQMMSASRSNPSNSNAVMGFYQSMNSFGGIFGALFAGLIYAKGASLPFVLAFFAFLISTLIGIVYRSAHLKENS